MITTLHASFLSERRWLSSRKSLQQHHIDCDSTILIVAPIQCFYKVRQREEEGRGRGDGEKWTEVTLTGASVITIIILVAQAKSCRIFVQKNHEKIACDG